MDNYPLILSQMLLCYTGSGDISCVRTMKSGEELLLTVEQQVPLMENDSL